MSSKQYTFIGPYAECTPRVERVTLKERACVTDGCRLKGRYEGGRFCRECGKEIGTVETETTTPTPGHGDLQGAMNDRLYCQCRAGGKHVWMSNMRAGLPYMPHRSAEDDGRTSEITPKDIDTDLDHFKAYHAAELTKLEEAYGAGSVKVRWGVVRYWM